MFFPPCYKNLPSVPQIPLEYAPKATFPNPNPKHNNSYLHSEPAVRIDTLI